MSGGGGGGSGSGDRGDYFEGDKSTGGNRWPRQETLALIQIRFDMDAVFRDSSLKGPLWDEISRKMGELGYHRSSKKCREKFENVYKYHKRTKDGRVGKSEGKMYRFYDQLEALDQTHSSSPSFTPLPPSMPCSQPESAVPVTMLMPAGTIPGSVTGTSNSTQVVHTYKIINNVTPIVQPQVQQTPPPPPQQQQPYQSNPIEMEDVSSPSGTMSLSSSTFSDEELLERGKRKRKWKGFFEGMVKGLIDKQVELQSKFLADVEKRESERLAREEAWMAAEISRLNREHELLAKERSMAAAKDAALIEVLQKFSNQDRVIPLSLTPPQNQNSEEIREVGPTKTQAQQPQPPQPALQQQSQSQEFDPQVVQVAQVHVQENTISFATPPIPILAAATPQPQQQIAQPRASVVANTNNVSADIHTTKNGGSKNDQHQAGSSRWPKAEVEALINLRTQMDQKYQENVPKGPLWEEISSLMKNHGYNRNAKRCKEKWENINKYFKKVKESNKKRPEDSKTCPYFHQLDALYQQKAVINPVNAAIYTPIRPGNLNTTGPIMARPEQQWSDPDHGMDDVGSGNDSGDDGDEGDDEDQGSGGFEFVANNSNNINNNDGNNAGVNSMTATSK